jgi:pyridoxamine 5'-phosphate oxidase
VFGLDLVNFKVPFVMFSYLFGYVKSNAKVFCLKNPDSFVLSTTEMIDGKIDVSSRILLLKSFDLDGFIFYTNYLSKKGKSIDSCNDVAMLFDYDFIDRQVRIKGKIQKISEKLSKEYFDSRGYVSRVASYLSKQSNVIPEDVDFYKQVMEYVESKKEVLKPLNWGGYIINPYYFEFFKNGKNRIHKRVVYEKVENCWKKYNLYP